MASRIRRNSPSTRWRGRGPRDHSRARPAARRVRGEEAHVQQLCRHAVGQPPQDQPHGDGRPGRWGDRRLRRVGGARRLSPRVFRRPLRGRGLFLQSRAAPGGVGRDAPPLRGDAVRRRAAGLGGSGDIRGKTAGARHRCMKETKSVGGGVVGVEVGQTAPDAQVVNADRKFAKLSDLRGKTTVLLFFPGAFTGACTKEMCAIRDDLAKLNALNAQVVGISVDSPFAQKAFADANGLTFTLLSDYNREAVKAFDVQDPNFAGGTLPGVAWRSVFVLDKDGVVRWKWLAPPQGAEPDYPAGEGG